MDGGSSWDCVYRRRISQSAQPTALRIPSVGEVRDEVGVPAAAGTLAQQPADDSAQAAPSPAEAELLGRLQELEASLAQERTEREAAEAAARTEAASQRARADSLAARTNAVDQAERARRAAEMDRDRIRSELDLLVSTLEDVTTLRSTNRGLEIVIGGALVPTGSSSLTARGRAEVESIAAAAARRPNGGLVDRRPHRLHGVRRDEPHRIPPTGRGRASRLGGGRTRSHEYHRPGQWRRITYRRTMRRPTGGREIAAWKS